VTQRTDGSDEDYGSCKARSQIRIMIIFEEKPWQIHVPAAAVIHEWQALSVLIRRKECVDCKRIYKLLEWLTGFFVKTFYLSFIKDSNSCKLVMKYIEFAMITEDEDNYLNKTDVDA